MDFVVVLGNGWETCARSFEKAAESANRLLAKGESGVYIKHWRTGKAVEDSTWQAPAMVILAMARESGA